MIPEVGVPYRWLDRPHEIGRELWVVFVRVPERQGWKGTCAAGFVLHAGEGQYEPGHFSEAWAVGTLGEILWARVL